MTSERFGKYVVRLYLVVFLLYMLMPLAIMGGAALNDSRSVIAIWPVTPIRAACQVG